MLQLPTNVSQNVHSPWMTSDILQFKRRCHYLECHYLNSAIFATGILY